MLLFDTAIFLHVPKTGGSWVRAALMCAGARFTDYYVDGDQHADLSYCPHPERFKFAFVRHPGTFYASYWRFKMANGWDPLNPFDVDCRAHSFAGFASRVLDRYPGWCSKMFEDYVGPPDRQIEFVGRFERLQDDLVSALRTGGVSFDESRLRARSPVNVSDRQDTGPLWSHDLAQAVARSERDALDRFGYAPTPWSD